MRKIISIAACVAAVAGFASSASATTATANIAVSASVASACTFTAAAGGLAFGPYTGAQIDVNTSLTANCANTLPYTIALNAGTATGATTSTRKLTSGSNTIAYSIFSDSARTQNWGNVTGTDTVAGTGSGGPQSVGVYGRIGSGLNPAAGTYGDTVIATITF
jgi:spore coat protein U-like protein